MAKKKSTHLEQVERIVSIARRLFAQKGVNETSLQDIAKECGIRKASLYYHFKSKEEILKNIFDSEFRRKETALNSLDSSKTLEEILQAIGSHFFSDFENETNIQFMKILISEGLKNSKASKLFFNFFKEQGEDPILKKLKPLLAGKVPEKQMQLFVFCFLGTIFNFAIHTKLMKHELPVEDGLSAEECLRLVCRIFSKGL